MANLNGFDANEVEPSADFEPIPAGKYVAVIVASEMKPTKAGDGSYLEVTLQIIEGEYKNRQVWARFNLNNRNPKAVQIARAELSSVCRAVGVMAPKDSAELHNLPLLIGVRCKRREDTGEVGNEVRGFWKKESANPARPQQAPSAVPPWRRP